MYHQSTFKAVSVLTFSLFTASVMSEDVETTPFKPSKFIPFEKTSALVVSLQRLPRVALPRPELFVAQVTLKPTNSTWFHTANVQLQTGKGSEYVAFEWYGRRSFHSGMLEYGAGYQGKRGKKCSAFSAGFLKPKLAVSVTQFLPLSSFEKRTPAVMYQVRQAKSVTMKVSYKPALLNGLKLHTEIGQVCGKKLQLNSGIVPRSRLKLVAAATYQANLLTSVKYQVSRINADAYDQQVYAKLSIPLSTLSRQRSVHAHCSMNNSDVQENLSQTFNEQQENQSIASELDSNSSVDSSEEGRASLRVAMSTTESLKAAQDPSSTWVSEIKNVFSNELVEYPEEDLLHPIVRNLVTNLAKLENLIPNANAKFFCSSTARENYGDFSKPGNYLSTFLFPITDSTCLLIYHRLLRDDRTPSVNFFSETGGYIDRLIRQYADLTFCFIKKDLIGRGNLVTFFDTFKKTKLTNPDRMPLQPNGIDLSLTRDQYTYSVCKNVFLGKEKNIFMFNETGLSSAEAIFLFCKEKFLFAAKKIVVPSSEFTNQLSDNLRLLKRIHQIFEIQEDGQTFRTTQTLKETAMSAPWDDSLNAVSQLLYCRGTEDAVELDILHGRFLKNQRKLSKQKEKLKKNLSMGCDASKDMEELKERFKNAIAKQQERLLNPALDPDRVRYMVQAMQTFTENKKTALEENESISGSEEGDGRTLPEGVESFITELFDKKKTDSASSVLC